MVFYGDCLCHRPLIYYQYIRDIGGGGNLFEMGAVRSAR